MDKKPFFPKWKIVAGCLVALFFAACSPDPVNPDPVNSNLEDPIPVPVEIQPIDYTPEVNDPVTNDFTMLKACIGSQSGNVADLLSQNGFLYNGERYVKTEEDITKIVSIYSTNAAVKQGELYVKDEELSVMLPILKQWMQEFHNSSAFPKLVRASFSMRVNGSSQSFSTYESFMAAVEMVDPTAEVSISFRGNDIYANVYEMFVSTGYMNWVELCIYNARAGWQPNDFPDGFFPEGVFSEADMHKNILISKVDYLTFQALGSYALNVQNPVSSGNEIPFIAQYQAPADFGWFKLFYQNTDNLLASGSIVWMGCGMLDFPESFKAGNQTNNGLPYPGQGRIAFINDNGQYCIVNTEQEIFLQRIWQILSKQEEFRYYYGKTHKKVAVYLYAPSEGVGDPADWYYLVFVEQ